MTREAFYFWAGVAVGSGFWALLCLGVAALLRYLVRTRL